MRTKELKEAIDESKKVQDLVSDKFDPIYDSIQ